MKSREVCRRQGDEDSSPSDARMIWILSTEPFRLNEGFM